MGDYINGYVTGGDYFTYKGVRYGQYTKVLFKEEFYKSHNEYIDPMKNYSCETMGGWKFPYFRTLRSIKSESGKIVWNFSKNDFLLSTHHYIDIDPERDIEKIITPVWYMEPKELVKKRLNEGTWIWYVLPQTLFYAACLLVSPIFKQWYLIWTIGLYIYIRLCYIELSKGELNRGW